MSPTNDVAVTVPMRMWEEWIAEGDAVGESYQGDLWGYSTGGGRPPCRPGDRVYIVAHGKLRGYSPLVYLERDGHRWCMVRGGGAVAVTIREPIQGFRGWRRRWWSVEDERPFPNWRQR